MQKIIIPKKNQSILYNDFAKSATLSFEAICKQLEIQTYCTYVSYAFELNSSQRIHYYSNKDWQTTFVNEGLINNCPLVLFGRQNTHAKILCWKNLASGIGKAQRRVMQARVSHNIGNGVGLQQWVYGMREIVTFASDPQHEDYPQLIFQNLALYKKYIFQLRTIALASMMTQGWLTSNKIIKHFEKINFEANQVTIH